MKKHRLLKKIANSLDFGDFRQIILYIGLSTSTHIEYIIKSSMVTYPFLLFWIHNNYIRKKLTIEQFFSKFVRCTPLNYIFGSKSRTLTQQNSRLCFSSIRFAHFM